MRVLFVTVLVTLGCVGSLNASDAGDKFVLKRRPPSLLIAEVVAAPVVTPVPASSSAICDLFANGFDPTSTTQCTACFDKISNFFETAIDCGGPYCVSCNTGDTCLTSADCASTVCNPSNHLCGPVTCVNGMHDGNETGVDCGGPECPACNSGQTCAAPSDCTSGVCNFGTQQCAQPSCVDAVKNGGETDIDCGGVCVSKCNAGKACLVNPDCASGLCNPVNHICSADHCGDGTMDFDESDQDCGGSGCAGCNLGLACNAGSDCQSGVCDSMTKVCLAPSCMDGTRNANETGVDCGGDTCTACGNGQGCQVYTDCASNACVNHVCQ